MSNVEKKINLTFVKFLNELKTQNINFCHWKSNNNLLPALQGEGDLDLLVDRVSFSRFISIALANGFMLAVEKGEYSTPYVYHLYAVDEANTYGTLHLHVYFQIITAGSLAKNYHLPLENVFFNHLTCLHDVPIPIKEADILLFVFRKYLEQCSIFEHYLFIKDHENIKLELDWLMSNINTKLVDDLLSTYFPKVDSDMFWNSLLPLKSKYSILKRVHISLKFKRLFSSHKIYSWYKVGYMRFITYLKAFVKSRTGSKRKSRHLMPTGAIVSFVGPEASGKSTLSSMTGKWLSTNFDVKHVHLGKPGKSIYTKLFWVLIYTTANIKKIFRGKKHNQNNNEHDNLSSCQFKPRPLISALDSIDRYMLYRRCFKDAMGGTVVITDRFPTKKYDSIDGPQINGSLSFSNRYLSKIENYFYNKIGKPHVLFKVYAPLDLTLQRNAKRNDPEPVNFVKFRHGKAREIEIDSHFCLNINTTLELQDCFRNVKAFLWKNLFNPHLQEEGNYEITKTKHTVL